MDQQRCNSSSDTRNVHDVIHARGSIRSPSAQNMIQVLLKSKEPSGFINPNEAVSFRVREFGGRVMTKRNVHDFFGGEQMHQSRQSATQSFARRNGKRFLMLRSEVLFAGRDNAATAVPQCVAKMLFESHRISICFFFAQLGRYCTLHALHLLCQKALVGSP